MTVELVVVGLAATVTAALTAVAGAGGGIILLIVILQFHDPEVAIPLHGIIQFVSNGSRFVALRGHVERRLFRWYLPPLVPAIVVGFLVADAIPRDAGRAAVGGFALIATWWPAATAWLAPGTDGDPRRFAVVGAVAGITNPALGAPGPLLAPAFRAATTSHVAMVSTFALAQIFNHGAKVAVFTIAGVAWADHRVLLVVAGTGVLAGTRLGAGYVERVRGDVLSWLFRTAVTVGSLRLILA